MGVILYAILCGSLPFDPSKPEKLPKLIVVSSALLPKTLYVSPQKGQYSVDESLSANGRDLLAQMLCVDPTARISMAELSTHPWVMHGFDAPIDIFCTEMKLDAPLNQDIVREISLYTRIPYVEMTRMLRKVVHLFPLFKCFVSGVIAAYSGVESNRTEVINDVLNSI